MSGTAPARPREAGLTAFDARFGYFFALLGVIFVLVIVIDLSPLPLTNNEQRAIRIAEGGMYLFFVLEFGTRCWLAEDKGRFLRRNWFSLIVLLLPMLRPLLAVRSLTGLASGTGLAGIVVSHRGLAGLRLITRGRQLAYVVSLTVIVVLLATGSVFYLERAVAGSPFVTFGETLWWAATLVTTINNDDDPVTTLGRVIAWLVRIYALSIFGYITASIATWLIGIEPAAATRSGGNPPTANTAPDTEPADHGSGH